MTRFARAIAAIPAAALGVILLAPSAVAAPTPAPAPPSTSAAPDSAARISHDLAVKNYKGIRIRVCTHWGYSRSSGIREGDTCSGNGSTSKYDWLRKGEWSDRIRASDSDWDDVDGYLVPKDYRMRESLTGVDLKLTGYHKVPKFHKISPRVIGYPPFIDRTRYLYLEHRP